MRLLYVVSTGEAAGKTMIAAGLGKHFRDAGKKIGYLKPVSGEASTGDAVFLGRVLGLGESVDFICPPAESPGEVQQACARVSGEKDAVIIESRLGADPADNYEVARKLDARVIVVADYTGDIAASLDTYRGFGKNLLGVVINKVPQSRLEEAKSGIAARLTGAGINVLGIIPEDRALAALSVSELAGCVQGKILNQEEKTGALVENLMLGAMVVGSGVDYFGRKPNKAAVIASNRPDMQLAALETSTRCLVISGAKQEPVYAVLEKADNHQIPVILTEEDTSAIVRDVEKCLTNTRFTQEGKLSRLGEILRQHFDMAAVEKVLG
ncbi:MAG: DRTGG domain-containing protein [Chloroflexota bacterium]